MGGTGAAVNKWICLLFTFFLLSENCITFELYIILHILTNCCLMLIHVMISLSWKSFTSPCLVNHPSCQEWPPTKRLRALHRLTLHRICFISPNWKIRFVLKSIHCDQFVCLIKIRFYIFSSEIHQLWCTLEWISILLWNEIFITINQIFANRYFDNRKRVFSHKIHELGGDRPNSFSAVFCTLPKGIHQQKIALDFFSPI